MADTKTVGELTGDDIPKLIARVVAKALGIPGDMPKDIIAVAQAKLPDVDTCGLAPKPALLLIANFLAERGPEPGPEPEPESPSEELPTLPWSSEDFGTASKPQLVEFMAASCGAAFLKKH